MITLFQFAPKFLLCLELDDEMTVCTMIGMLIYDTCTFVACFDVIHKTLALGFSEDVLTADAIWFCRCTTRHSAIQ